MPSDPIHSWRWRRVRRIVLSSEPLCRMCKQQGYVTAATEVDHIKPRDEGGDMWDRANLQPLCRECHENKTRRQMLKAPARGGACVHGMPLHIPCPECAKA